MSSENHERPNPPARTARHGWVKLCPHWSVNNIHDVHINALRELGIAGVLLDLDNTLVRWHQEEMTAETLAWITELQEAGMKLCILSNSVLSTRSERIATRLGCFFVRSARKPGIQGFRKAMELMGTTPDTTLIVGDQMFTDILGGNRSGVYTVMVKPLEKHEFAYTRYVSRPPERVLLAMLRKRGHLKHL